MDIALERVRCGHGGFELSADLTVPGGAAVAVIGPSGGGKSTLIDVLSGGIQPRTGRVCFGGEDYSHAPPAARPLSVIFQAHNLFPHLTAAENVALGIAPVARPGRAALAAAEAALAEVGLDGLGARRPPELSGGQQSRVALARTLARDRPILLLDEPFAALGPALRGEMIALVNRLRLARGFTVVMVTHAPEDARALADLTVFVDAGQAESPRPTEALWAKPTPALAAYLG